MTDTLPPLACQEVGDVGEVAPCETKTLLYVMECDITGQSLGLG